MWTATAGPKRLPVQTGGKRRRSQRDEAGSGRGKTRDLGKMDTYKRERRDLGGPRRSEGLSIPAVQDPS